MLYSVVQCHILTLSKAVTLFAYFPLIFSAKRYFLFLSKLASVSYSELLSRHNNELLTAASLLI